MNNKAGLSLIELMITMAAAAGMALYVGNAFTILKKTEKIALDDMTALATQRLTGEVIRRDLLRASPSFGVLSLSSTTPSNCAGSFFDINPAMSCEDNSTGCFREYSLNRGATSFFYLLTTAQDSDMGVIFPPTLAYTSTQISNNQLSTPTLNRCNILGGPPTPVCTPAPPNEGGIPGGWINNHLYLLKSVGELPLGTGNTAIVPQCYCGNGCTIGTCGSSCAAPSFPILKNSSYLSFATNVQANGGQGTLNSSMPTTALVPNTLILNLDPALPGNTLTPGTFFQTLPAMGALAVNAQIQKVQLIRYQLTQTGTLKRSVWRRDSNNTVSFASTQDIGDRVIRVVFRRPSISTNQIGFTVSLEQTQ